MKGHNPPDPLDDPEYLRSETRYLHNLIRALSDPDMKKELAAHSFHLAQRAEAISRTADDPRMRHNAERDRSTLKRNATYTVDDLLTRPEHALDDRSTLLKLAAWYRSYAERAGSPAIWEARLKTAEDLEAQAERLKL